MRTRVTELLGVEQPVILGGMGSGNTTPELVAAVAGAGGLGVNGVSRYPAPLVERIASQIRERTDRPFGLNLLLFLSDTDAIDAVLAQSPPVFSTAWPWPDQDLRPIFERAHAAGAKVMHMVSAVEEAERAAAAGADLIVAQGTEGGGHVALVTTLVLTPMTVRAVAPVPVVAAGGIADGAGLAAALALGAEGVLMGTRFLATHESPWPEAWKRAIVESDGHDTVLSEIPDIARSTVWPGAFDRSWRNRLIEEWAGRENEVRRRRSEIGRRMAQAKERGETDYGELNFGQVAGLIDEVLPAAEVVRRTVAQAEKLLGAATRPRSG
jgi:NAD(P)H-dependent flavin oxidoreductase YrpB (nitropropane dioxygenase family)